MVEGNDNSFLQIFLIGLAPHEANINHNNSLVTPIRGTMGTKELSLSIH